MQDKVKATESLLTIKIHNLLFLKTDVSVLLAVIQYSYMRLLSSAYGKMHLYGPWCTQEAFFRFTYFDISLFFNNKKR